VGARNHGIVFRERGQWRKITGFAGTNLHAMRAIPGGGMLLADISGLWWTNAEQSRLLLPRPKPSFPNQYGAISEFHEGVAYYGDSRELFRIDVAPDSAIQAAMPRITPLGIPVQYPRGITHTGGVGRSALIHAVSWEQGLIQIRNGQAERFGLDTDGRERRGMQLHALDDRWILVGTSDGTLYFNQQANRFEALPPLLPRESGFAFVEDREGNLWIAGRRGLYVVGKQRLLEYLNGKGPAPVPSQFTPAQGLPSGNFGLGTSSIAHRAPDGEIWLASIYGATHFQPAKATGVPHEARAAVSDLLADGASVPLQGAIALAPGTRRVGIRFAALGRMEAQNPVYRYQLLGIDAAPVETTNPEAIFTNLEPGKYEFRVQAQIAGQTWSSPTSSLPFEILPYWYELAWVPPLGFTLLVLAVAGFSAYRIRKFRRHTSELERRVAERTEELRLAKDQAEASSRAKSQFIAAMSHEIRTPMNGMLGMVQLLEQDAVDTPQRERFETLRNSGDALLAILKDVLDLSKIEAGGLLLERRPFQPAELLADCCALFQAKAAEKGIVLRWSIADDLPACTAGDPMRLRQILMNLLGNAVKFTSSGEITVRLDWCGARNQASFTVTDTGIGIAPEYQATIFDPFTQADASTTRRFGGTGLGLTICAKLLRAMNGGIRLRSTPGIGSTFCVEVPLEPCALPQEAVVREVLTPAPRSVLLVEDNAVNRMVARTMLQRLGCEVTEAHGGADGECLARDRAYDLILMDLYMPDMDGFETARRIRGGGANIRTPIWALTASAVEEDRTRCLAVGMNGHLAKPIRMEELRETLLDLPPTVRTTQST
jgi:signal transduction histidine kinase/ActR/RegA family two-component response regulator